MKKSGKKDKPKTQKSLSKYISALLLSFASYAFTPLFADAHIFVYHRFGDDKFPSTNTSIKELKKEFNYLKSNGYKVVKLETLVSAVKKKENIPDNWVVLTIDDNFKSFYKNGLPVFKEFGYPFSLFVYLRATEKNYKSYTSWRDLKEIAKYGSLEYHSYAHPHMTHLSDKALRQDFEKGLKMFKEKLGTMPKFFAYPFGEYDNRVKNISKEYGFEAIINQNIGAVSSKTDVFDMDRIALVGKTNLKQNLKYKELEVEWIEPESFPKDGILKKVTIKIQDKAKAGGMYITSHGWKKTKIENGIMSEIVNKPLTNDRSRIVVSVGNKIKTKLLVKEKNGTE